jgi:hypothetical protein
VKKFNGWSISFSHENDIKKILFKYQKHMVTKLTKRPTSATPVQAPVQDEARLEQFIGGAPDSSQVGAVQKTATKKEARKLISHTLPPDLLKKIDEKANSMGLTRAGLINFALSDFVNR